MKLHTEPAGAPSKQAPVVEPIAGGSSAEHDGTADVVAVAGEVGGTRSWQTGNGDDHWPTPVAVT